jgi:NADP-dependent 3-hydroxy acid dehydrogenase YdfG
MEKNVMIWGATGGIGSALVRLLSSQGWKVSAFGRDFDQLQGFNGYKIWVDLQSESNVEAVVAAIGKTVTSFDWFIYAAGDILLRSFDKMSLAEWRRIQDANLNGMITALHYSLPLLTPEAPVYLLGAVSKRLQLAGMAAYAASKAGVEAFATVLAQDLDRPVVLLRPGVVMTQLWEKVPFKPPPGALGADDFARLVVEAYQDHYNQVFLDI